MSTQNDYNQTAAMWLILWSLHRKDLPQLGIIFLMLGISSFVVGFLNAFFKP